MRSARGRTAARALLLGGLLLAGGGVAHAQSFPELLNRGWEAYQQGDHALAEGYYREALRQDPRSEEARLGLTLPLIAQQRWSLVEQVCDELLADNPANRWGLLRRALARHQLGRFTQAHQDYQGLVASDPADGEAWLGLGWAEHALGRPRLAAAACAEARTRLPPADARPDTCLAAAAAAEAPPAAAPRPWQLTGSLYGSGFTYSDPWERRDLRALLVEVGARTPGGLRVGLDLGLKGSTMRYTVADEQIQSLGGGVDYLGAGWSARGHLLARRVTGPFEATSLTGLLGGGWRGRRLGLLLDGAGSVLPGTSAAQLEPLVAITLSQRWSLGGSGRWVGVWSDGPGQGQNRGRQLFAGRAEHLFSGGLYARWVPHPRLALRVAGWGGQRRYGVDADGLVFTGTADRFVAGGQLSLGADLCSWLSAWVAFQADWGDEQEGRSGTTEHDFWLYGGTVGLSFRA